jgi:EAL domain-containing protein (putative c-di-GMP-specific phosphodiesterase class I)
MTAEGIETEVQLAKIVEQGFTEGQGFLFSRPVRASAAQALLRDPVARIQAA